MKILFVWTGLTRCAGDCWRALAALPDVELKVFLDAAPDAVVEQDILHGLDYAFVRSETDARTRAVAYRPDILFVVGWHSKVVRSFVERADWADVPKVCCFDMPWRWQFRCVAARFVLWRYVRRFRAAYVPGRLGLQYANWLGFGWVYRGFLAMDLNKFRVRNACERRKGFLFVGRKSPEKRIDLIEKAFARYRELGGTWQIGYCHATPYSQMPQVYARNACLVLASERDAWPLVALEARASGCEVIQSDRCGNRFELDTRIVRFGNVEAMAREMLAVERGDEPKRATAENLEEYDCGTWARRTLEIAKGLAK